MTTNEITMPVSTVSYSNSSVTVCDGNNTVIKCICLTAFTDDQLYRRLYWLRALLRVDKKTTSAALRLRTSASDDRISAKAIGGFGVAILFILIMGIVLPDIIDLFSFVYKSYTGSKTASRNIA
ncbi:uncharacterized protein LOC117338844 [Pecten maximus]|uniref:uncharacterized protein LOC117338844 n=1 Tax=Pecten maximus TaxID=6579 RepID=UPI001458180E|nr:uncharacterized protein LOC117338844 [Pecten maximus]